MRRMMLVAMVAGLEPRPRTPGEVCCVEGERIRSERESLPRVLVGFVANSKSKTIANVVASFTHVLAASWVVALYDGETAAWAPAMEAAKALGVSLDVYDGRLPGQNCSKRLCPKLQFQLPMAGRLDGFDYLWLPDADIRLADLDWHKFWAWHAAVGSPVISQPTIEPSTQDRTFHVNAGDWFCDRDCLVLRTTYVEQQTPVIDAEFFKWLAPKLVDLANFQEERRAGWGQCSLWCGAAALYLRRADGARPPCAVINVPVTHLDTRTLNKTARYFARSFELNQNIRRKRWPEGAPPDYPLHTFVDAQHALINRSWSNGTGVLYNTGWMYLPYRHFVYFAGQGGRGL